MNFNLLPQLIIFLPFILALYIAVRIGAHRNVVRTTATQRHKIYDGIPDQATINHDRAGRAAPTAATAPVSHNHKRAIIAGVATFFVISSLLNLYGRFLGHPLGHVTPVESRSTSVTFTHTAGYIGIWFQCDYTQCVGGSPINATVSAVGSHREILPVSSVYYGRGATINTASGTYRGRPYLEDVYFHLNSGGSYVLHIKAGSVPTGNYMVIADSSGPAGLTREPEFWTFLAALVIAGIVFEGVNVKQRRRQDEMAAAAPTTYNAPPAFAATTPFVPAATSPTVPAATRAWTENAPYTPPSPPPPSAVRRMLGVSTVIQFLCVCVAVYSIIVSLHTASSTGAMGVSFIVLVTLALPTFIISNVAGNEMVRDLNDDAVRRGDPPPYQRRFTTRSGNLVLKALWADGDSLTHLLIVLSITSLLSAPLAMWTNMSNPSGTRYAGLIMSSFLLCFSLIGAAIGVGVRRHYAE